MVIQNKSGQFYSPRVALLWTNFGPYHVARARALAGVVDLTTIEFAKRQELYGWDAWKADLKSHVVLYRGAYESANPISLSGVLWQRLSALRPDVLLVPGYGTLAALSASLWGRRHNCLNILMSESTVEDQERRSMRERLKSILVTQLFDGAFVSGKRTAEYVRALGMPEAAIARKYGAVDNDSFIRVAEHIRAGTLQVPPLFLYVGRLAREKNLESLLREFSSYRDAGGSWVLRLVGRGPLEESMKKLADDLKIRDQVSFAGFKESTDLAAEYARAGCFVLASLSEPWGLVVNEAMASGLPVVVSRRCGSTDDLVIEQENGFIFDPGCPGELSQIMLTVSALPPDRVRQMGRRSQEIVSNYSVESWAHSVVELLRLLLDRRSSGHREYGPIPPQDRGPSTFDASAAAAPEVSIKQ